MAHLARECSYRTWLMDTPLFSAANFNRRDRNVFENQSALALLAVPEEIEMDISLEGCAELN